MLPRRVCPLVLTLFASALIVGCFESPPPKSSGNGREKVELEHPEGDPSVSGELGGPEFEGGEDWVSGGTAPLGDPDAIKGGTILTSVPSWPENIRTYGTGANTYLNSIIDGLCFETLCRLDANTLEFVPGLASHWKVSDDHMKFTFRIDPRAHWADGEPVTSEDVVATYELIADDTLLDPMSKAAIVDKMHEPKPLSKYMFEVECKSKDWRNFITLAGMVILPAHEIGELSGKEYLDQYNFKLPVGSGPYTVLEQDVKKNESLTLTRRDDWWGAARKQSQGLYNFDKIRFTVILDQRQSFEKAIKGDLDFYPVYTAKWWVEDLDGLEAVQNGWLIKQKIYTRYPQGIQGLAFNMRKPPLDDVLVRQALGHLYNRAQMVEKFAYNEYELLKSYYPGSDWENTENELVEYNPQKAVKLLEEAGWTEVGDDGIRRKDGNRLKVTISYRTPGLGKYYTTFKEDAKAAGVEVDLNLITPETHWKNQQERNFEISSAAWGAILFPNPRSNWHSAMADKEGSNNVTGLQNEEVDQLIEAYDKEFDADERHELLRQLDAAIHAEHPYSLGWYLPCERLIYWNKFGTPDTVLPKYADWRDAFTYWWADPSKEETLKAAQESGSPIEPIPPEVLRPWDAEDAQTASAN